MCSGQAPKNFPSPLQAGATPANPAATYPVMPNAGGGTPNVPPVGGNVNAQATPAPTGYTTMQQMLAQLFGGQS